VRAKQEEGPPAVAGQHPPHDTQSDGALIGALQLHIIVAFSPAGDKVQQPHRFHDLAVVSLILPDQQVGNSARIVEIGSHNPCRDYGHVLAVEPRPRANETLMPSASLFALLHRLISLIVVSSKIPVTRRVRKESVKVRTPKSPPSADDSPFDFAALHIFPDGASTEVQHVRCFTQGQEAIAYRRRRVSL
jgi:hypothetical protein